MANCSKVSTVHQSDLCFSASGLLGTFPALKVQEARVCAEYTATSQRKWGEFKISGFHPMNIPHRRYPQGPVVHKEAHCSFVRRFIDTGPNQSYPTSGWEHSQLRASSRYAHIYKRKAQGICFQTAFWLNFKTSSREFPYVSLQTGRHLQMTKCVTPANMDCLNGDPYSLPSLLCFGAWKAKSPIHLPLELTGLSLKNCWQMTLLSCSMFYKMKAKQLQTAPCWI